jgi:hypothetical protein
MPSLAKYYQSNVSKVAAEKFRAIQEADERIRSERNAEGASSLSGAMSERRAHDRPFPRESRALQLIDPVCRLGVCDAQLRVIANAAAG